MNTKQKNN